MDDLALPLGRQPHARHGKAAGSAQLPGGKPHVQSGDSSKGGAAKAVLLGISICLGEILGQISSHIYIYLFICLFIYLFIYIYIFIYLFKYKYK